MGLLMWWFINFVFLKAKSFNLLPPPMIRPPPLACLLFFLSLCGRCCGPLVIILLSNWVICCRLFCLWGCMRVLLETLDMSHSYACVCNAIAIVCACVEIFLYFWALGGFSLLAWQFPPVLGCGSWLPCISQLRWFVHVDVLCCTVI